MYTPKRVAWLGLGLGLGFGFGFGLRLGLGLGLGRQHAPSLPQKPEQPPARSEQCDQQASPSLSSSSAGTGVALSVQQCAPAQG